MPSRRQFLAAATGAALAPTAGCVGDSDATAGTEEAYDWPTAGLDGGNTRHVPDGVAPREGVSVDWSVSLGLRTAEPVAVGDAVFATVGKGLAALDAETGEERWSVAPDGDSGPVRGPPTVAQNVVYVAVGRAIRAHDFETGEELWTTEFDRGFGIQSPTLDRRERLLFVGSGESAFALDAETGDVEWERELFGRVTETVAVGSSAVYAATEGGELYALAEYSGEGYWRRAFPDYIGCPPVLARRGLREPTLFVGCHDGYLYALGQRGQRRWRTEIGGFAKGGIAVADGVVYADGGRELHALDGDDGSQEWRLNLGTAADHPPTVVGDTVYVGGDRLRALKLDGGFGVGSRRVEPARFTESFGGYVSVVTAANGRLFAVARPDGGEPGENALYALGEA